MQTSLQIANDVVDKHLGIRPAGTLVTFALSLEQIRDMIVEGISYAIVDKEKQDRLSEGQARFTVQFDREAWSCLDDEQKQSWVNEVHDLIQREAYITLEEVGR